MPAPRPDPFGRTLLVTGPEALLAERTVAEFLDRVRAVDAGTEIAQVEAERLDLGRLTEITGASLFSTRRAVVISGLADLPVDLADAVADLAAEPGSDLALALVHGGGAKGKNLLDRVRKSKPEIADCPAIKTWDLPKFVQNEARRAGGTIDAEAAGQLIDAVGHDLRALAGAVAQLLADASGTAIVSAEIGRYFAGRAEVTSFAVADAVLQGRTGVAMEQLRWAIETGVPPVLVTSALANGIRGLGKLITAPGGLKEADLARDVEVPPWKLKSMRMQARGWDQRGLASALQAVATADAAVKGAVGDPDFALEQAVLAVSRARRR